MDRSIFESRTAHSSAPASSNAAKLTSNAANLTSNAANLTSAAASPTGATPTKKPANLIANTPALHAAQEELKSKAILSLELAESEAAAAETVQQKKTRLETLEAENRMWLLGQFLVCWQPKMRFAFRAIHGNWRRWNPARGCFAAWHNMVRRFNQWDEMVEKAEQARKEYEKAKEELAELSLRTEYVVSCVEGLRAYLVEVRMKQQLGA